MRFRADSSPRRRAVLLAALFAVLVPVALVGQVGCRKTPQSTGRATRHTPEAVAAMNDEVFKIAVASLRRSEQMENDEAFRQLIDRLNQWLKLQKPIPGWAIDPMVAPLAKCLAVAVGEIEPSYQQLAARRNLLELKGRAQMFAGLAPKLQSVAAQVDVKKLDLLAAGHERAIAQIESAARQVGDPARLAEVEAKYQEYFSGEVRDKAKHATLGELIALAKVLDPPSRLRDTSRLGDFVQQLDALAGRYDPKELKAVAEQFQAIITRKLGPAGHTKLWAQIGFIAAQLDELASLRDLVQSRILKRSLVDLNEQLKAAAARAERDDVRQLAAQIEEAIKRFDLPELVNLIRQLEAAVKPGSLDDLGDFGPRLADAAKQLSDAAGRMDQSGQSLDVASLRELADFCRQLGAGFGEIAARLKAPGEAGKPATPGKPAIDLPAVAGAFQERMGEFQLLVERLSYFKGLDALEFPVADRFNLGEAVLSRDLARWARGDEADDVSRAKRLFDWTIRNVQLEPDRVERAGKTYLHVMQFPWETMLFGRGTVAERIWQFILLARQQGIDAAALALEDATDASHRRLRLWAVGVLSEGNVYVFEPSLGLPIPASGGLKLHEAGPLDIQPATLAQLAADDRLLRQLDADREHPYPVKSSDLKRVVALVAAEPWSLTQRMKMVESRLAGDDRMVLSISPSAQAQRFKAGKGVTDVRPWPVAYDTLFQRIRLGAEARAWEASMMTPFVVSSTLRPQTGPKVSEDRQAPMFWESNPEAAAQQSRQRQSTSGEPHEAAPAVPLLTGRMLQLKGRFVGEPGATLCYQMCRLSDRQLAQLGEAESQQQLVAQLRVTKQFATYWLGLLAYEQRNYPSARDYLGTRTLEAASVGPWTAGAKYNLGRVCEMEKQYAKAISLYRGNDAAVDGAGNRIRARWLESLAKPADLEKAPGPTKPKDEKETPDLPGLPDMPALPDAAAGKKPAAGVKDSPAKPAAPKQEKTPPPAKAPEKKTESVPAKK